MDFVVFKAQCLMLWGQMQIAFAQDFFLYILVSYLPLFFVAFLIIHQFSNEKLKDKSVYWWGKVLLILHAIAPLYKGIDIYIYRGTIIQYTEVLFVPYVFTLVIDLLWAWKLHKKLRIDPPTF